MEDPAQGNFIGGDKFDAFASKTKGNPVTQFKLPHPSASGYGHDLLIILYADDFQCGCALLPYQQHGFGSGLDEALKVCTNRALRETI